MKTVVLTGASMGIGRALAVAWAARGAKLVLSARSENALHEVAKDVVNAGGKAIVVPGDVTDEKYRLELIRRANEEAGGIDVLVNNAGRGFYAPALQIDVDRMREMFELNVFAPLRLVQLAAPALAESRGTVVMMSSVAGIVAAPRYAAYAASKFALEAISMSMRAELAERGVRVVVIRPGPVDTPFRSNATKAEGVPGYDKPDPRAQSAGAVAALTLRAVERGAPVVETSAFVRVASAASRLAPGPLRLVMRRMATKHPEG
ncbi:short-chain dehydrogenase/reductase SDR [Labilithrix luteola]|uniref:Short-chain dehydrogenase/reductase SDR n=1 Tax=Labilithrix luteola TaxID=1391654 RepID=A0A0K1PR87_9BACT|nr:SDR family NAD(P)-dependent oxidoreductase [Labilithrix luteola]AKU96048.1 short-chain dehydrogenase/reductase SDR [Labilithrix luteola]